MNGLPVGMNLGLVCLTESMSVRYRTITLTRFRALPEADREAALTALYQDNVARLAGALEYCPSISVRLYRMPSSLFPMADLSADADPAQLGLKVLRSLGPELRKVGALADQLGIRVVTHPDQFIVLNSDSPTVRENSIRALDVQAEAMDLIGLPRSAWATIILHGGKGGRSDELAEVVRELPEGIRSRLALENDERAYDAQEILSICLAASVPMIFDPHHEIVHHHIPSWDDPRLMELAEAASKTWTPRDWQLAHLSNGRESLWDNRHNDLVSGVPDCLRPVPWVEVEAKGKERAILTLNGRL